MVRVTGRLQSNDAAATNGSSNPNGVSRPQGTSGSGNQGASANADRSGSQTATGSSDQSSNAATGVGTQASAQGHTADRAAATIRVDDVKRVSGSCGDTR